jgi:transmembrane protein EpsG
MDVYIFTLLVSYILAILAVQYGSPDKNNLGTVKPSPVFVFLIIVVLVSVSGLRYMNYLWSDEWLYRQGYLEMAANNDFYSVFAAREWGLGLLSWVLSRFSYDSQTMIFVVALITNTFIVLTLARYGRPFELSVMLYIAFVGFFSSFNILRQCLAMSIVFWGLRYVLEGKFWSYLLLVLIGAVIHSSTWLVLPVYFVVRQKKLSKLTIPLGLGALLIMVSFQSVASFFLTDSIYSNYLDEINEGYYGVSPIRVATYFAPLIGMLVFKERLIKLNPNNGIFINYCIISCLIMFISLIYVYVARIDTFFGIVALLIVPQLTRVFSNQTYNKASYMLILSSYFIFGLYQASISPEYYNIIFSDISDKF